MRIVRFLFLFVLIGCTNIEYGSIREFFCGEDDCAKIILGFIENANTSIHCSFYSIDIESITNELVEKSTQIDVKLVMNGKGYKSNLKTKNLKLTKGINHNKFCIIDENIVITGSFNPTKKGRWDHNNILVINSKPIANPYETEFKEQWHGLNYKSIKNNFFIDNKKISVLFCPEDDCYGYYSNVLATAKNSIYFMVFSFTNENIADILLFSNAKIKGIFDNSQINNRYSQYKRLRDFGLNVKEYDSNKTLHHKVFIIDNRTVITGSANPTNNGFFSNDENIVIIHDNELAEKYLVEFNSLFNNLK